MYLFLATCTTFESSEYRNLTKILKWEYSSPMKHKTDLLKVALFQFYGQVNPQDDAKLNFFPDSKRSVSGLLNDLSCLSGFILKDDYRSKTSVAKKGVQKTMLDH